MKETIKTDVIIIGAGPTGLGLACQLVRYGIDFVILEMNEGITPYSKALGVHARTLEIYDQMGFAQKAIEQGTIAGKAYLMVGGKVQGEMDFSNIGEGLSPYPFVLFLEQSKNEELLYEFIKDHGKDVLWKTTLENFTSNHDRIVARVKTAEGDTQQIESQYLVGCDGPKSVVRHTLGLQFEGSTFERLFYVADAKIDWNFQHDALRACLAKNSFILFFPLKGEKRYRIVGVFPEEFSKDENQILYDEIENRIKKETQFEIDIYDIEWFSTYKVHTRKASTFFTKKCFLAGDAGHVHSPAGAQGMNTGIQDVYNLAWKLAWVIRKKSSEKLFETYNEERLTNADKLLKTTDRMFELAAGSGWFLAFFRLHIFPSIAKFVLRSNRIKKLIFPLLSQIGVHYRHSSLSQHADDQYFKIKAGDRMPYFMVDGESFYAKLKQPTFHYLIFTNEANADQVLKTELKSHYPEGINMIELKLTSEIAKIFGSTKPFGVLLRPDNYIGLISKEMSLQTVINYFSQRITQ